MLTQLFYIATVGLNLIFPNPNFLHISSCRLRVNQISFLEKKIFRIFFNYNNQELDSPVWRQVYRRTRLYPSRSQRRPCRRPRPPCCTPSPSTSRTSRRRRSSSWFENTKYLVKQQKTVCHRTVKKFTRFQDLFWPNWKPPCLFLQCAYPVFFV